MDSHYPFLLPLSSCPGPSRSPLVVSDLITSNASWNTPLLHSLFSPQICREIQKIHISPSPCPDYLWTPSSSGKFTTSSAYSLISSSRVSSYDPPLDSNSWKHLWKLKLNARLKLFLWKIAWDIIPTKARLKAIFPIAPDLSLCPLCKSEEDSLPHLFFKCCFARVAWRSSFWPLDSLAWASLTLPNWIKGILSPHSTFGIPKSETHLFQIFAAVLCDLLWFSRNKAHHEGIIPNISILASTIRNTALVHAAAWKVSSPSEPEPWCPPPLGHHKINFDTAIRESFSAQAAVCRNHKGQIIKAISLISPPCSPNYGEALAAQLAASLATSLNLENFTIEGDSLIVITALQHPSITQDWLIEKVIKDTLVLLPPSSKWAAKKINRSANFCAHHVAYWAAARVYSGCIPTPSPSFPPPPSLCNGLAPPAVFFPP
jgi:hypothetical protein